MNKPMKCGILLYNDGYVVVSLPIFHEPEVFIHEIDVRRDNLLQQDYYLHASRVKATIDACKDYLQKYATFSEVYTVRYYGSSYPSLLGAKPSMMFPDGTILLVGL